MFVLFLKNYRCVLYVFDKNEGKTKDKDSVESNKLLFKSIRKKIERRKELNGR